MSRITGPLQFFLIANYWLQRSVILNPLRKLQDGFVKLAVDSKAKAQPIDLVAKALTTMESQVKNIYQTVPVHTCKVLVKLWMP